MAFTLETHAHFSTSVGPADVEETPPERVAQKEKKNKDEGGSCAQWLEVEVDHHWITCKGLHLFQSLVDTPVFRREVLEALLLLMRLKLHEMLDAPLLEAYPTLEPKTRYWRIFSPHGCNSLPDWDGKSQFVGEIPALKRLEHVAIKRINRDVSKWQDYKQCYIERYDYEHPICCDPMATSSNQSVSAPPE